MMNMSPDGCPWSFNDFLFHFNCGRHFFIWYFLCCLVLFRSPGYHANDNTLRLRVFGAALLKPFTYMDLNTFIWQSWHPPPPPPTSTVRKTPPPCCCSVVSLSLLLSSQHPLLSHRSLTSLGLAASRLFASSSQLAASCLFASSSQLSSLSLPPVHLLLSALLSHTCWLTHSPVQTPEWRWCWHWSSSPLSPPLRRETSLRGMLMQQHVLPPPLPPPPASRRASPHFRRI